MAGKQIIIDGVDVSECNFCEWKSSDIPQCRIRLASFEPTCKGYNCHYKQLKRKEQECEELKQTLAEIKEIAEKTKKDICNNCGWKNADSCDPENYTCGELIKILQKISECEVEDEK